MVTKPSIISLLGGFWNGLAHGEPDHYYLPLACFSHILFEAAALPKILRFALQWMIFGVSITGGKGSGSHKIGQVGPRSGRFLLIFNA
jgi:hypothetical protein